VRRAGGAVTHDLGIIDAVAARLTPSQLESLEKVDGVSKIYKDHSLQVSVTIDTGDDTDVEPTDLIRDDYHRALVDADDLHHLGIDGYGVTVAVVDTGLWITKQIATKADGAPRILALYDAILDLPLPRINDGAGHGTHVTSIMVSSPQTEGGFQGIAPNADLVFVKAFDRYGRGTYSDVIRAIDWIVRRKDDYGIRVLNLSFSAPPRSYYWDDPLNQAVMAAWQAGIVVVAATGNDGPGAMTVGVPANVPYIITVGAMSDNLTSSDNTDDFLCSFSSTGPTVEGFVKPEVIAPGGHILGLMPPQAIIPQEHPEYLGASGYFTMSGTSQAAAVVSGVVALMLHADPGLTPDEAKCRLMSSARPAVTQNGSLAYSIFQQGAGMVNAYDAALGTECDCANQGLDIGKDLAGLEHYGGRANRDEDGNYYIMGLEDDGTIWSGGYAWSEGYLWSDVYFRSNAYLWSRAAAWSDAYLWYGAYLWSRATLWSDAYLWSRDLSETIAVNKWVDQQ